jgi:hypothetical protein
MAVLWVRKRVPGSRWHRGGLVMEDQPRLPQLEARSNWVAAIAEVALVPVLLGLGVGLCAHWYGDRLSLLIRAAKARDLPADAQRSVGPILYVLGALALFYLLGLAFGLYRAWLSFRWRGTRLTLRPEGVHLVREHQDERVDWRDVLRVTQRATQFCVTTRHGDTIALPFAVIRQCTYQGARIPWWPRSWHRLLVVGRAYLCAARRGPVMKALGEPPALVLGYGRPKRPLPVRWRIAVLILHLMGALFVGGMTWVLALEAPAVAPLSLVGVGTLYAVLWWEAKCGAQTRLRADGRGFLVRTHTMRRLFRWEEVDEIRRPRRRAGDLRLRVGGEKLSLTTTPVLYANLSLLARSQGLEPVQLLSAILRYYKPSAAGRGLS